MNIATAYPEVLLDCPRLMRGLQWSHPPTFEESEVITDWEERYLHARVQFEERDPQTKGRRNPFEGTISPEVYLRWLRTATQRYEERNAEHDPSLRRRLEVTHSALAGYGIIAHPPRHGEVALTVGRHGDRVRGDTRGYTPDGWRVHLHHTPKYEYLRGTIEYHDAISVGIGDDLHQQLHKIRDPQRTGETRFQEVTRDFDFIRQGMLTRGYTHREVMEAREKTHELNDALGIYNSKAR